MNRLISFAFVLFIVHVCSSCSSVDYEEKAIEFYEAMNSSSLSSLRKLYDDSVRVSGEGFKTHYSFEDYQNWLSWDSVFHPTYKILDIELGEDYAEVTISKACKRINYLNDEPTISKEKLHFENGKVKKLEMTEILLFHTDKWLSRRDTLVNWIAQNHPELDGFIFDQTKQGALNYLKAIELYEAR